MTEPTDTAVKKLVRKFRIQKTFEFQATISPDGADALATLIELLNARWRAAEALIETQKELIRKQAALEHTIVWWNFFLFGIAFWIGWSAAGAAG
jgi:hypothetical protein